MVIAQCDGRYTRSLAQCTLYGVWHATYVQYIVYHRVARDDGFR